MGSSYVIEVDNETAGLAVRIDERFRFYAAEPKYAGLDGKMFGEVRDAHRAATRIRDRHAASRRAATPEAAVEQAAGRPDDGDAEAGTELFVFTFFDSLVQEVILADVASRFAVGLDLVEGRFDRVGEDAIGTLTLQARGEPSRVAEAMKYLRSRRLLLELRARDATLAA